MSGFGRFIAERYVVARSWRSTPSGLPSKLFGETEQRLRCLENRDLLVHNAIIPQLGVILLERLGIDNSVVAFPVIITTEPNSDVLWVRDLETRELITCDFCHVEGDLGVCGCRK